MVRPVRCEREAQTRREVEFATSHENLRVPPPPNGLRLSGARMRVRCSRSLDGPPMRAPLPCRCSGNLPDEFSQSIVNCLASRKCPGKVRFNQYEVRTRRGAPEILSTNSWTESRQVVLQPQVIRPLPSLSPGTHEPLFALPSWR
jgi:hypothetical protein